MLVTLDLLTLFLLVALGFYVFVADPRNRAHQTFAAFNAFLALWTVKDLLLWDFPDEFRTLDWWVASSFVTGLLMQYSLAVFAWVFPENRRTPRRLAAILFSPGAVLVPAALAGALWNQAELVDGELRIGLSASGYLFVGYILFIFCFGTAVLIGKFARYRGTEKGAQLGAILWGLAVTALLQSTAFIVLPLLGDQSLIPHSSLLVVPGVLVYAYAILNLRLFSLQSVLDGFRIFPLSYKVALSVASVAIVSFIAFQIPIVWFSFKDGFGFDAWRKYLVFSMISALVPNLLLVLLVVRSVSRPLRKITVAAVEVAEGSYGTEVDLRRTNDEIGLLADSFNAMSRKMSDDIERLRDLNEKLTRTEKLVAIGTLAAGVAHEVNNPLASVSSIIQRIRDAGALDEGARGELELVSAQLERVAQVTRDMMDFARARAELRQPVDINAAMRTALRLASFDRSFRDISVATELAPRLPRIMADGDRLQQVFLNLLLNAKDAMPEGGSLDIRSFVDGSGVTVEVSDTGRGIDDGDAVRIFDPFFTTKPAGKGSGLGLSVCYGIVTSHGGRIHASRRTGGGTTFAVTLPLGRDADQDPGTRS